MLHQPGVDQKGILKPDQHTVAGANQTESRDVQLVCRIAVGDRQAFDALYRQFFPRLERFLNRLTKNTAQIEEIINDTLYVVWEKSHTYNQTCKVSTWIFSIAYRTALKSIQRTDEPAEFDIELIVAEPGTQPDSQLSQRQLQHCVSMALDALSREQRTVVNLAYYHGMGYEEIALTMDCPVNTVKTRMFHARSRLKNLLSKVMESL